MDNFYSEYLINQQEKISDLKNDQAIKRDVK